jgi:alpha-galactosidase
MLNPDGSHKVCEQVWISSIGCSDTEQTGKLTTGFGASPTKIGPEYTFALAMEKNSKGPILLIKTSWGGKSIHTDFRPPSAGPYVFDETQLANFEKDGKDISAIKAEKVAATGVNYRLMIEHVKHVLADIKRVVPNYDETRGHELAGFVWFQGWNDMVDGGTYPNRDQPGGYGAYSEVMAHFIRDVRQDLNAPELPFVIGVLGVGGPVDQYDPEEQRYKLTHQNFRLAMAAPADLPEFKGNVIAVWTEKYWDRELTEAKSAEEKIKQQAKQRASESKLQPAEEKALQEKMLAEGLSERQRQVIEKGISNFAFHYLGSAKILGAIGKAFSDAIVELKQAQSVR